MCLFVCLLVSFWLAARLSDLIYCTIKSAYLKQAFQLLFFITPSLTTFVSFKNDFEDGGFANKHYRMAECSKLEAVLEAG